jgi:arylsulfatase A-like enzyme
MYEAVIRVPLLIYTPERRQRRDVHKLTSAVDLMPTLLYIVRHPGPDWSEGRMLPTLSDKAHHDRSAIAVKTKSNPKQAPLTIRTGALLKECCNLIHYSGYAGHDGQFELYGLVNDPEEMDDLYQTSRSVVRELRDELENELRVVDQPDCGNGATASQEPEPALLNQATGS